MTRIIAWFKSIRLSKVITVFLAGILLFVSTACNGAVQAKSPDNMGKPTADQIRREVPSRALTSPYEGGMNDYSDVDPRKGVSDTQSKARDLVENAQGNLEKRADSPEQYRRNYQQGTPLGERVRRLGEDASESAEDVTKGVSKGTQRGVENLKENTQDAANKSQRTADKASNFAQDKANEAASGARRALDKAADVID